MTHKSEVTHMYTHAHMHEHTIYINLQALICNSIKCALVVRTYVFIIDGQYNSIEGNLGYIIE